MPALASMNIGDVTVSLNAKLCKETFCTAINGKGKEHWLTISDKYREFALHITPGVNFNIRPARLMKVQMWIDGVFRFEKDWNTVEDKVLIVKEIPLGLRGRKDRPLLFGSSLVKVTMQEASLVAGKWKAHGAEYFREFHIKELKDLQARKKGKKGVAVKRKREAGDEEEGAEKRRRTEVESTGTAAQKVAKASKSAEKLARERRLAAGELAVAASAVPLAAAAPTTPRQPLTEVDANSKVPASTPIKKKKVKAVNKTSVAEVLSWLEDHQRTEPPTDAEYAALKALVKSFADANIDEMAKGEKRQVELVLNLLYHIKYLFGPMKTLKATSSKIMKHFDMTCLPWDDFGPYLDTLKECDNWIGKATSKTLNEWNRKRS